MAQTYVEKFNYYLSIFLNEIKNIYPEYEETLQKHFSELLKPEGVSDNSNQVYVKKYMSVIQPHLSSVAAKNEKIFKGMDAIFLLPEIDFRDIWSKDINQNTRENIWKYLQTLVVIGKKIVGEDEEIDVLLEKFNSQKESTSTTSEENSSAEATEVPEGMDEEMLNMLKNMSTMTQDPDDLPNTSEGEMKNLFEGGIISDIAQELTQELDLDSLDMGNPKNMNEAFSNLMGGNGQNNFFNLVTKVGEKIQNKVQKGEVNQGDLMKEAQKMMGGLKNPEKMANIMKAKHQQTGGATRDRLRKKLEERKAKQSS